MLWTWEPEKDRWRVTGAARALGLGPLAPECSSAAMLALADKKVADEAARIEAIARGDTASKWLPAALRAAGVLKEGESL